MADANLTGAVALALGAVAISAVPAAAGVVVTPVDLQLSTLPSGTPYLFAADQFGVFNGGGGLLRPGRDEFRTSFWHRPPHRPL